METEDFGAATIYKFLFHGTPVISDCLRVTTCDIMCTSNTAKQYDLPPVKGARKKAHLPYRQPDMLPAFSSGATDMQLLVNSGAKAKRCVELKKEREEFMASLHQGRDDSKRMESYAATRIQAVFRGYRRRRGPVDLEKIEKERRDNPRLTSSREIRDELTKWASAIRLKPVHGLSLESTIKKSTHQKKLEAHAASTLKNFLRVAVACARVNRKRLERLENKKSDAATTIQRFFKYIVFQTKLEGVVSMLKRKGAVQIQTYCRGFLARFRLVHLIKFLFPSEHDMSNPCFLWSLSTGCRNYENQEGTKPRG